ELTGWGDVAALDSPATREVMVDLRTLPDALRQDINESCALGQHCAATVTGTVVHIRGPGISELGIEARDISLERQGAATASSPLFCGYDAALASVQCFVEVAGPLQIEAVSINDDACIVWNN